MSRPLREPRAVGTSFLLLCTATGAVACGILADDVEDGGPGTHPLTRPRSEQAERVHAKVRAEGTRCATCHDLEGADAAWRERAMRVGHDVTQITKGSDACNCCHLGPLEGFSGPVSAQCRQCHEDVHVAIPRMAETHCLSCHAMGPDHDLRETAW